MAVQSPLMKLKDAAAYLQRSPTWVYRNADKLGVIRDGGPLRFRVANLDRWIERHEVKPRPVAVVPKRAPKPVPVGDPDRINPVTKQRYGALS